MITCIFENGVKTSLRHVVVHAIIEQEGKLLMVKRASYLLEGNKWSLPSGFLDRDENVKDCLIREVREETGWESEVIKLFKINSNPYRPNEDRQNVALDFIVKLKKKVGQPDRESTQIKWIEFNKISQLGPLAFDHEETIRQYLDYIKKPFSLPIVI